MARVARRRTIGRSRSCTNPSMTIWPASVPVIVEAWPAAISATAKAMGATVLPRIGASRRCASWMSATSCMPALWNVAAAMTSSAALTKKAPLSATTESMVLKRTPGSDPRGRLADAARLHQRRVQVEVVRHHGGAEDADRQEQRALPGQRRHEARRRCRPSPAWTGRSPPPSRRRSWSPGRR